MGRLMNKIGLLFLMLFLIVSCATPQQQLKATEGEFLKTGKTRTEVIDALVGVLNEEGYVVDNINEKYGIVSCQPYDILTGQLMTKLGEPGGGIVGTNSSLKHTIKFNANVTENGDVRIKATALEMKDDNIITGIIAPDSSRRSESIDVFRTLKLNKYFMEKLQARLGVQ